MKKIKFYIPIVITLFCVMTLYSGKVVCQTGVFGSADKMNVLFIGIDNPVTLIAPGYTDDKVRAEISNGTITKNGNGKYSVLVTSGTETTISLYCASKLLGTTLFRVRPIPSPRPGLAGKSSGAFFKSEIVASPYITIMLENFYFDVRYTVVSFTFTCKNASGDLIDIPGSGNMLNAQMISMIQSSRRGDRFWIEDIIAQGPTGAKNIGSISIRISQ